MITKVAGEPIVTQRFFHIVSVPADCIASNAVATSYDVGTSTGDDVRKPYNTRAPAAWWGRCRAYGRGGHACPPRAFAFYHEPPDRPRRVASSSCLAGLR